MRNLLLIFTLAIALAGCNLPATPLEPAASATPAGTLLPPGAATATEALTETPAVEPTQPATQPPTGAPATTQAPAATSPPTLPPPTEVPATATSTATEAVFPELPDEAILILEPGPGSRVTSPVRVSGIADPTFEQTLGVRILLDDGTQLALGPAIIEVGAGERGPFSVDVPFDVDGERQGFIQVFSESPRDGGITHLSSVGVTLAGGGEVQIATVEPHPERITIFEPRPGAEISGGVVQVEGFALASFEQTLYVEVLDDEGNILGAEPVIVEAPDLGIPGPFRIDIAYEVSETGPGRVIAHDPSPAFGGDNHASSVEVTLAP